MVVIKMKICNFNYLYGEPNIDSIERFINQLNVKYNARFEKLELLSNKLLLKFDNESLLI